METGRHINKTRGGKGEGEVQRVGANGKDENVCVL